jgi:beta-phosphoglucomutase
MNLEGVIFDIDGVLVDSPHEPAWRESLQQLMESDWRDLRDRTGYTPERFSHEFYQEVMAGKPRLAGARSALEALGVPDAERRAVEYAERKQRRVLELIEAGEFHAYPDALRFLLAVKRAGLRIASASSSKNARPMLERIRLDTFAAEQGIALPEGFPWRRRCWGAVGGARSPHMDRSPGRAKRVRTLMDAFDADVTGRDFPRGKPDPMIFLAAAAELGLPPASCAVVEDAPAGIEAAKAGGMAGIAVAREHEAAMLLQAGADLVVATLDEVDAEALAHGRLQLREGSAERR